MIEAKRLRELFSYDPLTGEFTRKVRKGHFLAGTKAGSIRRDGYVLLTVDLERDYAHRLAHLYMTGEMPNGEIDHIDTDPSNNRWANLRPATRIQNAQNRGPERGNRTGLKGVRRVKRTMGRPDRYYAMIRAENRDIYLGIFATAVEAHAAYVAAANKYHAEFARIA